MVPLRKSIIAHYVFPTHLLLQVSAIAAGFLQITLLIVYHKLLTTNCYPLTTN